MTLCWICRQCGDSAEHRIKKSDLVNLYGAGAFKGENSVVLVREGRKIPIQGPNSKQVKYAKNLCAKCNNDFSQPFDKAYEKFINYTRQNENLILKRRFVDFREVYGDDFAVSQCNLYKYFVKSFGCRLANDGYPIPEDLPSLLSKPYFKTRLRLTLSVCEDSLFLLESVKTAGKGSLYTYVPLRETLPTFQERFLTKMNIRNQPLEYLWNENFEWLYIWYWYNIVPNGKLGSMWVADSQFVYLGSYEPLTEEQRKEFFNVRQEASENGE